MNKVFAQVLIVLVISATVSHNTGNLLPIITSFAFCVIVYMHHILLALIKLMEEEKE